MVALLLIGVIGLLIGLAGVLIHLLVHFPKAVFDAPRGSIYRDNKIENEAVGQVKDKKKEKKP